MRFHVVLNRDGGTFSTLDMDAYRERASAVFAEHGHQATFAIVAADEIEAALKKGAARKNIDAMIAGGGDGTISTAARIAWKSGTPLGVIPAGTMNLFARSLRIPLDIDAAVSCLAGGGIGSVDIASANGAGFIHQVSVGLHPRMVRFRNAYDFSSRLGKIRASARAALDVIFDPPSFAADMEIDGQSECAMVSVISVSNNPFGSDPLLYADRLGSGELGLYTAPPMPPSGVARLVLDILSGRRARNPDLVERRAKAVTLRFPHHRKGKHMVLDGELLPLPPELEIQIHPGALNILIPDPEAGA